MGGCVGTAVVSVEKGREKGREKELYMCRQTLEIAVLQVRASRWDEGLLTFRRMSQWLPGAASPEDILHWYLTPADGLQWLPVVEVLRMVADYAAWSIDDDQETETVVAIHRALPKYRGEDGSAHPTANYDRNSDLVAPLMPSGWPKPEGARSLTMCALAGQAICLAAMGQHAESRFIWQHADTHYYGFVRWFCGAMYGVGHRLWESNQPAESVFYLERVLEEDHTGLHVPCIILLSMDYSMLGRFVEALAAANRVDGTYLWQGLAYGAALAGLGGFDAALDSIGRMMTQTSVVRATRRCANLIDAIQRHRTHGPGSWQAKPDSAWVVAALRIPPPPNLHY